MHLDEKKVVKKTGLNASMVTMDSTNAKDQVDFEYLIIKHKNISSLLFSDYVVFILFFVYATTCALNTAFQFHISIRIRRLYMATESGHLYGTTHVELTT